MLKLLEKTLVNRAYQLTRTLLFPARAETVDSTTSTVEDGGRERFFFTTAILSTGGVLLYLPHHLDLASEDSVGHSTCMSVLARRRAILRSIVQPKRSCLGLFRCCHVLVTIHAGASQGYVLGIPLYPTGRSST